MENQKVVVFSSNLSHSESDWTRSRYANPVQGSVAPVGS